MKSVFIVPKKTATAIPLQISSPNGALMIAAQLISASSVISIPRLCIMPGNKYELIRIAGNADIIPRNNHVSASRSLVSNPNLSREIAHHPITGIENPRIKNGIPIPIATMSIIAPPISNQSPIEMSIEVDISAKKMLHSFLDVGISRAEESRTRCLENKVGMVVQRV